MAWLLCNFLMFWYENDGAWLGLLGTGDYQHNMNRIYCKVFDCWPTIAQLLGRIKKLKITESIHLTQILFIREGIIWRNEGGSGQKLWKFTTKYSTPPLLCNSSFCPFSMWNLDQILHPMAVLKSDRRDDSKAPPTCSIWWNFGWDNWG